MRESKCCLVFAFRRSKLAAYLPPHRTEILRSRVRSRRGIKAKDGPDLIVSGSSTLISALLEHGLADEMLLLVNPVLLGKGKRLFAEGTPPRAFVFESSKATPTGILANKYKF